jgi:hypothetical protein
MRLAAPSWLMSAADRLSTFPGTFSTSTLIPGTGVVPMTRTPGGDAVSPDSSAIAALDPTTMQGVTAMQAATAMSIRRE